jgi:hypothetical protein
MVRAASDKAGPPLSSCYFEPDGDARRCALRLKPRRDGLPITLVLSAFEATTLIVQLFKKS